MPDKSDRKNAIRRFRERYLARHPGETLGYQKAGQWYDTYEAIRSWLHDAPESELAALQTAAAKGPDAPLMQVADALLPVALHATSMVRNSHAMVGRLPTGRGGMSKSWRDFALDLRQALDLVHKPMDRCLPGEPEDCSHDYAEHCMSYLAALQAYAELGLQHLDHGDPASIRMAGRLVEHWRKVFAADMEHEI